MASTSSETTQLRGPCFNCGNRRHHADHCQRYYVICATCLINGQLITKCKVHKRRQVVKLTPPKEESEEDTDDEQLNNEQLEQQRNGELPRLLPSPSLSPSSPPPRPNRRFLWQDEQRLLILNVTIKNRQFPAVINSGSAFNLVTPSLANQLRTPMRFVNAPVNLRFGNGTSLLLHRATTINLEIDNKILPIPFLVYDAQSGPLILGLQFLMTTKTEIKMYSETLTLSFTD